MKILWFVNIPFPKVAETYNLGRTNLGGWMTSFADVLKVQSGIKLSIACMSDRVSKVEHISYDDIDYYVFPGRKLPLFYRRDKSYKKQIKHCLNIIDQCVPDVIEIYGTENFYGLLTEQTKIPVLLHIQGVINEYVKYYFGQMSFWDVLKRPDIIRNFIQYMKRYYCERDILCINKNFAGRTIWDKSLLAEYSKTYNFYTKGEVLRESFYDSQWKIDSKIPYTIYSTGKGHPYKGTHILLKSIPLIKRVYPQVKVRVAGSMYFSKGYGKYLKYLINKHQLTDNVEFLGNLNEEQVVSELISAHVFALPSLIENSPNSLGEAQLVGTPVVSSFTGGISSMVENGKTGLLFPRGDYAILAEYIMQLFKNDNLALELSEKGREVAKKRHDPIIISNQTFEIYRSIAFDSRSESHD